LGFIVVGDVWEHDATGGLAGMITPQVPGGYGLGTSVRDDADRPRFGHTGGNAGYGCWLFTWPARSPVMATLSPANRT
jgi:hypothetical protein